MRAAAPFTATASSAGREPEADVDLVPRLPQAGEAALGDGLADEDSGHPAMVLHAGTGGQSDSRPDTHPGPAPGPNTWRGRRRRAPSHPVPDRGASPR